jgi:ATP-binding cassette, subfamily B, bacterial PglK
VNSRLIPSDVEGRAEELGLWAALRWMLDDFLPGRRRWQALGVVALMILGGLAEVVTLAAVFPLLSFMADPQHVGTSRVGKLALSVGVHVESMSLPMLAMIFCVVAIVAAGVRIVLAWASQSFAFRLAYDLGVGLYKRMLYQPYSFHAEMNSSRIVSSVNNVQRLLTSMFLPVMQGLSALVLATFIVGGLLMVRPSVALAAIVGFGGIYLVVSLMTRARLRRNADAINAMRRLRVQAVQEGLGGIRDVLIDNSQEVYIKKFASLDTVLRDAQAANALIAVTPRFVVEALGMVFIVAIAAALYVISGTLAGSLPVLAVLALGAQRLMPLLQQIYNAWANVIGNRAMFLNVVYLLRRPLLDRFAREESVEPLVFKSEFRLDHIGFRYGEGGPLVLQDINIPIKRGSWTGLVGKSGSGKSTLTDLVMGLLRPSEGQITVDGEPLDEHNVRAWQRQIAHVSQHVFLADASVLENVAFGVAEGEVDRERVRYACKQAELDDLIDSLPDGLDTWIGERGVRLSGGQRQRIGIARALYKRACVLVLDEATSALDDLTEAGIMASIRKLGRDYTVLMIAHRVTTLRDCDVIYRLEQGKIIQAGNYASVIGAPPPALVTAHARL